MKTEDYFKRIEQEIEYFNYREVKKLALNILRVDAENVDAKYIRDYMEYHKKSNGRYEKIDLPSFLNYVYYNIKKFSLLDDNQYFLKCIKKDLEYIYLRKELCSVNDSGMLKKVINMLLELNNFEMESILDLLKSIQRSLNLQIKQDEEKRIKARERERIIAEEEDRKSVV